MRIIVDELPVEMDISKDFKTNCLFEKTKSNGNCMICEDKCHLLRSDKSCPFLKKEEVENGRNKKH